MFYDNCLQCIICCVHGLEHLGGITAYFSSLCPPLIQNFMWLYKNNLYVLSKQPLWEEWFLPLPRRLCFRVTWFVRLFVCEFICEQDNSKTYARILMKFSGYVCKGKRKK